MSCTIAEIGRRSVAAIGFKFPKLLTREICKLCFQTNGVGFRVPDATWNLVVPARFRDQVVCLSCFTRLADEQLVEWDAHIQFFPVSLTTHLGR